MAYISSITELKKRLIKHGLWAKKSFGQNFLIDESVLLDILDISEIEPNDTILEIGPGPGALTERLCEQAGQVKALELDDEIFPVLQDTLSGFTNVQLMQKDALQYNPEMPSYKLIANIPYYITGKILRHYLVEVKHPPSQLIFMIQKEVAQKICAKPGKESAISLFVKAFGEPYIVREVLPYCFLPAPKVTSAVLKIHKHATPKTGIGMPAFSDTLDMLFLAPRKQLLNVLQKSGFSENAAHAVLASAQVDPMRRAQTLSHAEVDAIAKAMNTA